MAEISSTSNSRVKVARKLQRKRHRDQMGLCLLEGLRLVQDAWEAGARFETLFVTGDFGESAQTRAGVPLLAECRAQGIAVFTISDEVLAAISETVTPQGIVAVTYIPQLTPPPHPSLILVLDQVRDPGNAGTLLRSAAAAGVEWVIFAPGTVDAYNNKVLRAAMGAHFRLPIQVCQHWQELFEILKDRMSYVADAAGENFYDQVDWTQPAALIIGGEASGPTQAARRVATSIAIPMQRSAESLNAAVAGSVILFEAARQRRNSG